MSRIRVEIENANLPRLFRALGARRVAVYDVSKNGTLSSFSVAKKHRGILLDICEELCYTIRAENEEGVSALARKTLARIGLPFAALLCIGIVVLRFSFVGSIVIDGETAHAEEIRAALDTAGIEVGSKIRDISPDELSKTLSEIDGVSRVQAGFRGVNLVISVRDSVLPDESVDLSVGGGIYAACDCTITKMSVIAGTAKVRVGDVVIKGQMLVEGFEGEGAERAAVLPRATVYGEIWFSEFVDFREEETVAVRSGEFVRRSVYTVGERIVYADRSEIPFAAYETESEVSTLSSFLPLRVRTDVFYETVPVTRQRDFEAERASIEADVLERAREKVVGSCTVTDEYAIVTEEADYIRIRGVVAAETIVSGYVS